MEAIIADETLIVEPVVTVFELAPVVLQDVLLVTGLAGVSFVLGAAFNVALPSLEFVVSHAVDALSSAVPQTAVRHLLASVVLGQVEAALAVNTSVVIEFLAVLDIAVGFSELEG